MPKPRSTRFRKGSKWGTSHRYDSLNPTGSDIVEQDIGKLKRIAENPAVQESIRAKYREGAETLQTLLDQTLLDLQLAEQWGVRGQVAKWSDKELAEYVADAVDAALRNRETLLARRVRKDLAAFGHYGWLPKMGFERLFDLMFRMFVVAIGKELGDRGDRKEDRDGRAVREMLVEEHERARRLHDLAKEVAGKYYFPGEKWGRSQETPSLACEKIWEAVENLTSVEPVAANREALLAFIRGSLNRVPKDARSYVRTRVKTECGRSKLLVQADHPSVPRSVAEENPEPLIGRLPDPVQPDLNQKLLLEQIRSRAHMTEQETKVIELIVIRDQNQKDAADKLGISQGEVSKRYKSAIEKLRRAADSRVDTNHTPDQPL